MSKKTKKPMESFQSSGFPLQPGVDVSKLYYAEPLLTITSNGMEYDTYLFKNGIKSVVAVEKKKESLTLYAFSVSKIKEYLDAKGYFSQNTQKQMSLYSPLENIISGAKNDHLAVVFLESMKAAQDKKLLDDDFAFIVEEIKPKKIKPVK